MNVQLTNFNLICEQIILQSKKQSFFRTFSKNWTFEQQFGAILPFIYKKCELAMANFYEPGKPGQPIVNGQPDIIAIEQGTQTPGFKVTYDLDNTYVKQNLFPCLLADSKSYFAKLNNKYRFSKDDAQLVIIVNATINKNFEIDLAKITSNDDIPKFSVGKWDGKLYLNFKCPNLNRDKSNIEIGDIDTDVDVEDYKPLSSRIFDYLRTAGKSNQKATVNKNSLSDYIGDAIAKLFGTAPKKDNKIDTIKGKSLIGNIGKVPGCKIKCAVKIDKSLKKNISLNARQNYNVNNLNISSDSDIAKYIKSPDFTIDRQKIESTIDSNKFFNNLFHYNSTDVIELFDTNIAGNRLDGS